MEQLLDDVRLFPNPFGANSWFWRVDSWPGTVLRYPARRTNFVGYLNRSIAGAGKAGNDWTLSRLGGLVVRYLGSKL